MVPRIALLLAALPSAAGWAQPADQAAADAARKAVRDALPISPALIEELAKRFKEDKIIREESVNVIASPISRSVQATFVPGQATNIVQTVKGYPTAVSFFDSTGSPWPIVWDTNSNSAGVSGGASGSTSSNCNTNGGAAPAVETTGFLTCVPVKGSNVLQITPMSLSPRGGLLVNLQGAPKPLVFLMIGGQDRNDGELSVRVTHRGPNAKMAIDTRPGAPVTGAPYLNGMLAGIAPADARPLQVEGVSPDDVRAWRMGNETYLRLRSPSTLLSPPWNATERGEGDVQIYAFPSTPVVLLTVNGRTVSATLKD